MTSYNVMHSDLTLTVLLAEIAHRTIALLAVWGYDAIYAACDGQIERELTRIVSADEIS